MIHFIVHAPIRSLDPERADEARNGEGVRVTFVLSGAGRYRFRYLGEGGLWFDEEAADGYEGGADGPRDCILET